MEGNETVPTPQEPVGAKPNVDRKAVDAIYAKMKESIASEPVEGEVKVTAITKLFKKSHSMAISTVPIEPYSRLYRLKLARYTLNPHDIRINIAVANIAPDEKKPTRCFFSGMM